MPARRPYASRGVPRRVTTYRSGGRTWQNAAAGPAALAAAVALVVAGFVWVADPALFGLPATLIQSVARSNDAPPADPSSSSRDGASQQSADAPGATGGPAAVLQMAAVVSAAATPVGSNPTPTAIPTVRQWDSSTPGLVTDPALAGRLDQALAGVDGHVSVAVKDLGSGRGAALDGDLELPAASLYKLTVLYT